MQRDRSLNQQRGLTLIEVCATLAIASILIGTAAPSFKEIRNKRQLDGTGAELLTDIHFARSEAVTRNQGVRIRTQALADGGTCVIIHTGGATDCSCGATGPAVCTAADSQEIKTHRFAGGGPQVGPIGASMRFDPVRGTATPAGTLRVVGPEGRAIHHVVSAMGRVRSCSPGGSMPGYRVC